MYKIIKIEEDIVYIGGNDGSLQEVNLSNFEFEPNIGDSVSIFINDSKTIIMKAELLKEEPKPIKSIEDKIHINIVNESQNTAPQFVPPPLTQAASFTQTTSFTQTAPLGQEIPRGRPVNKVTYCVLAFFLGSIGVHKFFAGKTGLGFVYLIFCWTYIPFLVSIFEFFVGLTKTADAQGNIIV